MKKSDLDLWSCQSSVTDVGPASAAIAALSSDLPSLRYVSQRFVEHYAGSTEGSCGPVRGERLAEVDLRYASAMFARLLSMGAPTLFRERPMEERIAGCCRDFSVLFVAMARAKGIPARIRNGYAAYFQPGWLLDHVIAEVWDGGLGRWRLVEPEITDRFAAAIELDPLDVPRDRFLTGPSAWLAARSGQIDPERCVVSPDLEIPYTRSWPGLRHHLVQDLASLSRAEMVLWDEWGILEQPEPLRHPEMLDALANATADPACPAEEILTWSEREGLRVPPEVTTYSPAHPGPARVDVRRVLAGMARR